jgi:hypothetical protein
MRLSMTGAEIFTMVCGMAGLGRFATDLEAFFLKKNADEGCSIEPELCAFVKLPPKGNVMNQASTLI